MSVDKLNVIVSSIFQNSLLHAFCSHEVWVSIRLRSCIEILTMLPPGNTCSVTRATLSTPLTCSHQSDCSKLALLLFVVSVSLLQFNGHLKLHKTLLGITCTIIGINFNNPVLEHFKNLITSKPSWLLCIEKLLNVFLMLFPFN